MKFEKANKVEDKKEVRRSKTFQKKKDFSYTRLFDYVIHNNVAICLMNPEMKGHFNYLNQLINDGKKIMPWMIKITCISESWTVYIGHNSTIKNSDIDLESIFKDLEKNGVQTSRTHNVYVLSNIRDKFSVEEIVNLLLKHLEESKLKPLEIDNINIKYTIENKVGGLYTIPDNFLYDNDFDDQTYKKFLFILDKLEKILMNKKDRKIFHRIGFKLIRNKYLNKEDREKLNDFMKTYFPEGERIKIAMNYLLNRNGEK